MSLLTSGATRRSKPPRGSRREAQQRFERGGGAGADAGFKPMADADERDDGRGFHEINVPGLSAEQCPRAIAKRRRRAEGDERVHVRAANLELPPCAAIKLRAGKNLNCP